MPRVKDLVMSMEKPGEAGVEGSLRDNAKEDKVRQDEVKEEEAKQQEVKDAPSAAARQTADTAAAAADQ